MAGIFALAVNEGAYMTEIVRAGIISIDPGQMEAARSLGMTYGKAMRRIVLPQAARVIVPPLGNEFNNMLKTTSLLVVISVQELFVTFADSQRQRPHVVPPVRALPGLRGVVPAADHDLGRHPGRIERRLAKGTPGAPERRAGPDVAPVRDSRLHGRRSTVGGTH